MATSQTKSVGLLLLFLFILSFFAFAVRARPLQTLYEVNGGLQGIFKVGLSKWSVKTRGSSRGGKGHAFTTADVLGGIKNFGPSPGRVLRPRGLAQEARDMGPRRQMYWEGSRTSDQGEVMRELAQPTSDIKKWD
ncbi:hypothetical protein QJS10_CPA02g00334 [Acorus calamus]|uniref:Uncharacterized protein n=1 Tax=Acorus calamus TaxID=4465 RepID=A0AAV9FB09_ACOCL|nr:hypothetical protein QJS10_CPA02g00334 [Acorus calamus]